jgi:hypothetical protein
MIYTNILQNALGTKCDHIPQQEYHIYFICLEGSDLGAGGVKIRTEYHR